MNLVHGGIAGMVVGLFVLCTGSGVAHAATAPSLLIEHIQVGTKADASDEVVGVVNAGSTAVEVKGLSVEYRAATGTTWTKKATLVESQLVAPGAIVIFAAKQPGGQSLSSGLAQAGGNIRLVLAGQTLDQLAWGTGNSPEGSGVAAPTAGQIIARVCDPRCHDTQNNAADFQLQGDTATGPASTPTGAQTDSSSVIHVEITELLPDPAAPQTDAHDEYIELYNTGEDMADLHGWKLVSGKQTFKLDTVRLAPGQYLALTSATTKLGLTNAGDTVSLVDPASETVMTTPNYGVAKPGKTFGLTDGGWAWLDHPTPQAANAGVLFEDTSEKVTKTPKPTAKKSTTAKKSSASAKSTSAKSVASAVKAAATTGAPETDAEPASSLSTGWVLAILGIFAIGYGVYEYRPELLSLYARLRAKPRAGREPVTDSATRRRR